MMYKCYMINMQYVSVSSSLSPYTYIPYNTPLMPTIPNAAASLSHPFPTYYHLGETQ